MNMKKMKAVTFSYDDGVTQDQRLIEMLDRYGLKCTFNLNSGLLGKAGMLIRENVTVAHVKPRAEEIRAIYQGHEIAAHTLTHPRLKELEDDAEIVRQVEEDRLALSELAGYEVVGMAYPMGTQHIDDRTIELVREKTGIQYARTTTSTHSFEPQTDLIRFDPTVYHHARHPPYNRGGSTSTAQKKGAPCRCRPLCRGASLPTVFNWRAKLPFCRAVV